MFLPTETLEETAQTIRDAEAEWRKDQPVRCEFVILQGDEHIGGITLYFLDDRTEGELGWIVDKQYWGNGYAAEAARGLMDYAKMHWNIRRIIACCDSENTASFRLMEKLGLQREPGVTARQYYKRDETAEELTYSMNC